MQTPARPARSLFSTPITLPGSAPKDKYRTAQNSPLLFELFFVLWGPPTVTNLRQFLDQSLRTSLKYRVNKPTEGEIYIHTKKILHKHTLAGSYLPIYVLLTVKENT